MNNVYAVFDSCSGIFGDPIIAVNDAVARRMFEFSVAQPSIPKFVRDDAVLYGIGYFDNKTGCFTADCPPYVVCRGASVIVPDHESEAVSTSCLDGILHSEEVNCDAK